MRKWLLGAMCAMLVVVAPQSARAFSDGHELLKAAESKHDVIKVGFVMFVAGVALGVRDFERALEWSDDSEFKKTFCVGSPFTRRDVADAVRIWLRNRSDLQRPATVLIILALRDHFPCK